MVIGTGSATATTLNGYRVVERTNRTTWRFSVRIITPQCTVTMPLSITPLSLSTYSHNLVERLQLNEHLQAA
jgi:hypothetical protein